MALIRGARVCYRVWAETIRSLSTQYILLFQPIRPWNQRPDEPFGEAHPVAG